jgi:hypothetical protein
MAITPKGLAKPLEALLDYCYAMSVHGRQRRHLGDGSDTAMLQQFLLTVRPPSAPPAGDGAPVVTTAAAASPASPGVGQTVSFSVEATDDGGSLTFTWDLGDHASFGDGLILRRGRGSRIRTRRRAPTRLASR